MRDSELTGFPVCKRNGLGCKGYAWEAGPSGLCASCGGEFPDKEQLRRILVRQMNWLESELRFEAPETPRGRFQRGAMFALGSLAIQLGWIEDVRKFMDTHFEKTVPAAAASPSRGVLTK